MQHPIVSPEEWKKARLALLEQEKAFTRQRDELTRQIRALPWQKVVSDYRFATPDGPASLSDLFGPCSQLIVVHFMFDPDWSEGCKSCSLMADHYSPAVPHLRARDVNLVAVSRAPLEQLQAFRQRMGWDFPWVSSFGSDFNTHFAVTFTDQELASGARLYNFQTQTFPMREAPGVSVFSRQQGEIFHTYSSYARGLDLFIGAYNWLDIVPKGRDESDLPYPMDWVRLHDRYREESPSADCCH